MNVIKKRIGIVGGGQLGKMMILEAKRLGFYVAVLDCAADCPSGSICDKQIIAGLDAPEGYYELAEHADIITYEWENINAGALEALEKAGHIIYPSVKALKNIQNKFLQKTILKQNNISVPEFFNVSAIDDLYKHSFPMVLKTTSGGYDGKGVALIKSKDDIPGAYAILGGGKKELMVEEFIKFKKEISVIACRGTDGEKVIYPVAENIHIDSILETTIAPARITGKEMSDACKIAGEVMEVFEGVGTFCIELFVTQNSEILVNEVAPRPHNSGHYTIEGCFANQFENHIRAIVGLPLGSADLIKPAVMVNLLGQSDGVSVIEGLDEVYSDPMVHVHFYGKIQSKTGRKMGHFTVVDDDLDRAIERAEKHKKVIKIIGKN